MPWRRQPPVYSPVAVTTVLHGLRAAVAPGAAREYRVALTARLRERFGAAAVLLTDSGTGALTAALRVVLRERPGAAAALPAFGCYDLATAADGAGARVLLYDVDPHSLTPDGESLRAALQRNVAVVVAAHLYGYPADLTAVNRLAAEAGAVVIEDAAQAAGATLGARPAGSQASLSVLSFGRGKGWSGGGGGALLAFDPLGVAVLERARALLAAPRRGGRELLALGAQWLLARPQLYALPAALPFLRLGQTVYRSPQPLRAAARATCAATAAGWTLAEREVEVRRRHAERLLMELRRQPEFEAIQSDASGRPGYLRLPVLPSPAARQAVARDGAARLGVMPSYPRALCDLEGFAPRCDNRDGQFHGSRLLAERLCTFPTHGRLSRRDMAELVAWIQAIGGR